VLTVSPTRSQPWPQALAALHRHHTTVQHAIATSAAAHMGVDPTIVTTLLRATAPPPEASALPPTQPPGESQPQPAVQVPAVTSGGVRVFPHVLLGLAAAYVFNCAANAVVQSIGLPMTESLTGLVGLVALLTLLGDKRAAQVADAFAVSSAWCFRWLPLFLVPALTSIPYSLEGLPIDDLGRLIALLMVGAASTTSAMAGLVREVTVLEVTPEALVGATGETRQPRAFELWCLSWLGSLAVTAVGPDVLRQHMALPVGLCSTVSGYMAAQQLPVGVRLVVNPMVVAAVAAVAGMALHGCLLGGGLWASQGAYLSVVSERRGGECLHPTDRRPLALSVTVAPTKCLLRSVGKIAVDDAR